MLARLGDGETGGAGVGDATGLDVVDNDVEFDVFDVNGFVHVGSDAVDDVDVDAFDFAAVVEFEGGEKGVGLDDVVGGTGVIDDEKSAGNDGDK